MTFWDTLVLAFRLVFVCVVLTQAIRKRKHAARGGRSTFQRGRTESESVSACLRHSFSYTMYNVTQ